MQIRTSVRDPYSIYRSAGDHVPNAETKRAIEDAEKGKVIHATSVSDLMSKLRS